jgi:methylenetetrahydrofolate dehydrogenase (NADP+)/methenyltetrahydrofolate cyclohydrolase
MVIKLPFNFSMISLKVEGKKISHYILNKLREEILPCNYKFSLAVVLVSCNSGIKKFVELKKRAANELGINCDIFEYPESITEVNLRSFLKEIASNKNYDGLLVELPLPSSINTQNILNEIPLEKDIDVLSQISQEKFYSNKSIILPPAVEAVKIVFDFYNVELKNKKATVFGQGMLVGKPVSYWLEQQGVDVFKVDKYTKNPEKYSLQSDIIISGVGKPEIIGGDMVKDGVIAIDFGYENKEGKMVGDFNFNEVACKASLITPVPGGIGPIVVAAVIKNLIKIKSA